jgi:hypothetical protein
MLVVETVEQIRRENLVKGKTIKEIARDLGVSGTRPAWSCDKCSSVTDLTTVSKSGGCPVRGLRVQRRDAVMRWAGAGRKDVDNDDYRWFDFVDRPLAERFPFDWPWLAGAEAWAEGLGALGDPDPQRAHR